MIKLIKHPDYDYELKRVNYTIKYLKEYNKIISEQKKALDSQIDAQLKHFDPDNKEQFTQVTLSTSIRDSFHQKMQGAERSILKPYFARVDFNEVNSNLQKIYIGKMSLLNEGTGEFLIVDWRAPISNLYYDGRIGAASYNCPDGNIKGEIKLKRQYVIEEGTLENFFDVDITTNDDFLQACLGSSKDNRLKDIVSTIQSEQNRVIRANMWKPLIVQGAAGGGKTTIALHRIAYLIYTFEKKLKPENFMIIAPSNFFLSYISDVLPELGVENVRQTTFEAFAQKVIGKKLKIMPSTKKLSDLVNLRESLDCEGIKKVSNFKSSLEFKTSIKSFLNLIEDNFIPKEDFKIHTFKLFSASEIRKLFLEDYKNLPFMKRINEIKKHLTNSVLNNKLRILEEVEASYDIKLYDIKRAAPDSIERRQIIIKTIDERDALLKSIKKNSKTLVKNYLSKISVLSPLEYYNKFINDERLFNKFNSSYIDCKLSELVRKTSKDILDKNLVEFEDLAPLMYIKYLVYGLDENINVRHIIIDEAQDFSLFQFSVLKEIINSPSFTILGDLCQGIYSFRGVNDWHKTAELIFGENDPDLLKLEQSYRTTIEIMEAANSVIKFLNNKSLPLAKPVIRHGDPVIVLEKKSLAEVKTAIEKNLCELSKNKLKSAAIICKTMEECTELKRLFKNSKFTPKIVNEKEDDYSGGILIIPSYLVKGLEFDMVIVANASKKQYTADELDVKLLYIAMTRPLHKLYIYSVGEKADMLKEVNK
ncbi:RNA polymerase recycling motor HelD [Clostridium hydrogenum]|uniref:RNA polymerase recycling motor HelD n=1 Tax=Clostridium hydrogenum TaxID=2855764 RepID=UPI002E32F3AE|nr:RNA polymerase recycling motor HelD [Clostridium hydrogenum]